MDRTQTQQISDYYHALLLKSQPINFRWWKTLIFHMVDIAVVNSYILFTKYQELHPEDLDLQRASGKSYVVHIYKT